MEYQYNQISCYYSKGEKLNSIFGCVSRPIDKMTILPAPFLSNFLGGVSGAINSHLMGAVIGGMEKKGIK